jgi:protein-S-isoprenylcysteine O-methyltransferase Ste14
MRQKGTETLGYVINGISVAVFFYLSFTLDVPDAAAPIRTLGWIALAFGVLLMVLSTATLVRNRETGLIDWGIYGTVRHPMYLGAMFAFLSWSFFLPHWIMLVISLVNIAIVYGFMLQGERQNLTQFGEAYRGYMEAVPRINLVAGMMRRLRTK